MLAVLGIIAMTLVLVTANGKPIDSWAIRGHNISPTVFLSLIVGIVNGCIRFIMGDGVNISWWLKSLDSNTVIADLHRYWSAGTSAFAAMTCGRHFNRVALASFLSFIITIADGPLLQRAISPIDRTYNVNTTIAAQLAPGPLPSGFTGITSDHIEDYFPTPQFHKIITDYQSRAPIGLMYNNTKGSYNTMLEGAGFDIACNDSIIPWTVGQGNFQNMMWLNVTGDPIEDSGAFTIDCDTTNGTSNPDIKSDNCNTFLYEKHCTLRVAKVRYPMTLTNGTVSLARQLQADNQTIQMQYPPAEDTFIGGTNPSTIGGILQAAADLWTSKSQGSITSADMTTGFVGHAYNLKKNDLGECDAVWQDPTEDIFNGIREIMFCSAINASASTSSQLAPATRAYSQTVYESHMAWYCAALAAMLLNLLCLLALFLGYWKLGRWTSLSPVETAKAFEAPLLVGCSGNAAVGGMLKNVGATRMVYGEHMGDSVVGSALRIGDPSVTTLPRKKMAYA